MASVPLPPTLTHELIVADFVDGAVMLLANAGDAGTTTAMVRRPVTREQDASQPKRRSMCGRRFTFGVIACGKPNPRQAQLPTQSLFVQMTEIHAV